MKKQIFLLLVAFAVWLTGCARNVQLPKNNDISIHGSGNIVSREVSLAGFDCIKTGLQFDLTIRQGESFKITLSADDNFIDFIHVELSKPSQVFRNMIT